MSTPNFVNFGSLVDPTIAADQVALQRRMELAEALRKGTLAPTDPQMIPASGGAPARAVKTSPLVGLAKLAQAFLVTKMDQRNDEDRTQMAQRQADLLRALVGGGTTNDSTASTASLAQGAAQGDVGPTNTNAARMAQVLRQGNGTAPSGGGPLSLTGDANRDLFAMSMFPDQYGGALMDRYKMPDAVKTNNFYGVNPDTVRQGLEQESQYKGLPTQAAENRAAGITPEQANTARLAQLRRDSALAVRPDQTLVDFSNPQPTPFFTAPNPERGGYTTWNNGQPSTSTIPGAARVARTMSAANTGGKTDEQFTSVTLPDGRVVPVRGANIPNALETMPPPGPGMVGAFKGDPQTTLQGILAITDPQQRANAYAAFQNQMRNGGAPAPIPPGGPDAPGPAMPPRIGQSTAEKSSQENYAKLMNDLPGQVQQTRQTITGLENAYRTLQSTGRSGPGVGGTVNAVAILNNMGVPLMKDDANGYQTLKKYLENAATTAGSAIGASRTDAQFEQFRAGQPNAETMNPDALKGAIRYVLSQHDAALARATYLQNAYRNSGGNPMAVQQADLEWSQLYNPRVFEFSRMAPAERARFKAELAKDPQQFQKFGQVYNWAHQQGWVN